MEGPNRCTFSTFIDDVTITCSPSGRFDDYGAALDECPLYPCDKIKKIQKAEDKRIDKALAALKAVERG